MISDILSKNRLRVYYVVGLPRSGSTYVGTWIAHRRGIVNAGEVWQTFRTLGLVEQKGFREETHKWAKPDKREAKKQKVLESEFWCSVIEDYEEDPYFSLLSLVSKTHDELVDTSKLTFGLKKYNCLGCEICVVHTIRSFSSWRESFSKYHQEEHKAPISFLRMLFSYVKVNRTLSRLKRRYQYICVSLGSESNLESCLDDSFPKQEGTALNFEMFGARDFQPTFSEERANFKTTWFDLVLLKLCGCSTSKVKS
jgi:hypothetical protein